MQTVLVQSGAGKCTITASFSPLENRILHHKFSTIYQSKAYSKLVPMSQRSCKTAQDKIKQIGSKVSSSAGKFQKNSVISKIHPGLQKTSFLANFISNSSFHLLVVPVQTVSKKSVQIVPSFENTKPKITVFPASVHQTGQSSKINSRQDRMNISTSNMSLESLKCVC